MMNLSYTISPDRKTLTIHADEQARNELRSWPESQKEADETGGGYGPVLHTDTAMYEVLEQMTANSALCWISPSECGDLTDAPMLGFRDCSNPTTPFPEPVAERWAFMDYQVRSVLEDLRDKGQAVFVAP